MMKQRRRMGVRPFSLLQGPRDSAVLIRVAALVGVAALAGAALDCAAQTPAQMEYERQQREYWRQQEQQRQEQQRQQQIMQENARRQQEESLRVNTPSTQGSSLAPQGGAAGAAAYQGGSQAAAIEAARQQWLKRPPLPPDRNPLLGKWTRPASTRPKSSDPFAQLGALVKGGLCEALFGGGTFEFRADRLVGSDERTREQELDRVEYRGDSKHVAVLPKTTFRLILFDVESPDRIRWSEQDCVLVRAGAATPAAAAPAATAAPAREATDVTAEKTAVLNLAAGFGGEGGAFSPLAGSKFIVLRHSVEVALASRGFRPPPGVPVYKGWVSACQTGAPGCAQGLQGVQADALGVLTTDARGGAHTPPLPAGTYYLFGSAKRGAQPVVWNHRVELKPGSNSVQLDQRNAAALN